MTLLHLIYKRLCSVKKETVVDSYPTDVFLHTIQILIIEFIPATDVHIPNKITTLKETEKILKKKNT